MMTKIYEKLNSRARRLGVNINKLSESVGVPSSSVYNWKQKDPNAVEQLSKVMDKLTELESNKKVTPLKEELIFNK